MVPTWLSSLSFPDLSMWYAMATRVGGSVAFCDGNPPRSMQCWKGSSAWTGPGRGFGHHGIDRSIGSLEMVERWKRSGSRVGPQFQGRNGRGSGSRLLERQGGRDGMKRPNPFHLSRFRSPHTQTGHPGVRVGCLTLWVGHETNP